MTLQATGSVKAWSLSNNVDVEHYDLRYYIGYPPMVEMMLALGQLHAPVNGDSLRIGEYGAGKGPVTRRIVERFSAAGSIVAVEVDPEASQALREGVGGFPQVKVITGDCIDDKPSQPYHLIFTAMLADLFNCTPGNPEHDDKSRFFHTIVNNLEPNGVLIDGAPYIRPCNVNVKEERDAATIDWHQYVIVSTPAHAYDRMKEIEEGYLAEGLRGNKISKVPTSVQEDYIREAGLDIVAKVQITPAPYEQVGALVVYALRKPA